MLNKNIEINCTCNHDNLILHCKIKRGYFECQSQDEPKQSLFDGKERVKFTVASDIMEQGIFKCNKKTESDNIYGTTILIEEQTLTLIAVFSIKYITR